MLKEGDPKTTRITIDESDEYSIPQKELERGLMEAQKQNEDNPEEAEAMMAKTAECAGTC